ncbi:TetR/AcrR family transcriptional regulator [Zavarzinia sp. CC-PAN008]|uniref:TetR/AcrR family transcriptional regulator n=1 Tax=Zavarzinia sp. CC-PAN008 TaxID=3243332 RepID=UPI003F749AB4
MDSRRRLLEAAAKLFVERGYHATRPQDIAREADVGNGTFYLHFTDKRTIFVAFAEQACAELEAALEPLINHSEGFLRGLEDVIDASLRFGEANPQVLKVALMDLSILDPGEGDKPDIGPRNSLARMVADAIERAAVRGEVVAGLDPMIVAHAMIGMVEQAAAFAHAAGIPRDVLVPQITRLARSALQPPHPAAPAGADPSAG